MSTEEAEPYIRTTKWFCAGVATYVVFIWSLKLNMLFFFKRVVNGTRTQPLSPPAINVWNQADDGQLLGLWVEKFIVPAMCLVGCTFIANMGILFGACRPYDRMWVFYEDEGGKSNTCIYEDKCLEKCLL